MVNKPLSVRLSEKIDFYGDDYAKTFKGEACWLWTRAKKAPNSYGFIWVDRAQRSAHRVTYALERGVIPEGLQIDHLCRTPSCVNPRHLEAVTPRVNVIRSTSFGAANALKTHCIRGHAFTGENTYVRPKDGARTCRQCYAGWVASNLDSVRSQARERQRAYRARRKESAR